MEREKALRRHCDLTACGKLYRYSSSLSRTCSPSCRKRLYLERKKAAAQVEQEQNHAWADATVSIARVYRPVVARVIEPPCGPVDGLLSPLGLRVNHLLSIEQRPVW